MIEIISTTKVKATKEGNISLIKEIEKEGICSFIVGFNKKDLIFTLDFSPQIKDFMGSEATNNLTTTGLTVDQNILVSHYGRRCNNYFNNQGEYIGLGKRHLGGIHTININTSQHPNHKAYKQKIINTETGKTYDGEFDEFLSYDKTSKIATVKNNNMEIKIRINHIIGQQILLAL